MDTGKVLTSEPTVPDCVDRPLWPPGVEIAAQACDAFEVWRSERDPDGEIDLLTLIELYAVETK